jgi:hypothetical protein
VRLKAAKVWETVGFGYIYQSIQARTGGHPPFVDASSASVPGPSDSALTRMLGPFRAALLLPFLHEQVNGTSST